jgi:myosin heavy subunit
MFNLFPKKKSVNEIIEDVNLTPSYWPSVWTPTQTPSMLQAQNELIEQFLKENHDLKIEIQQLKRDVHQPELCKEKILKLEEEIKKWENDWDKQNKNIIELTKEVNSLRHLKQENADLIEILAKYRDGYQGSCYACEPVGELNQKLEHRLTAYQKMVEGASETIEKLKKENADLKTKHFIYPLQLGKYEKETLCEITGHKIPSKVSWEEVAGDLALRVAWLEKKLAPKEPAFLSCACSDCGEKTKKWNQEQEDNNPLYKHF